MGTQGLIPGGLSRRFARVAAGLAAGAVLLTALASWWLIREQHERVVEELAAKERRFHAATVAADLDAIASRMDEIARSTILATGLVDSAGRETYLGPFLGGIRQINGVPVQVLFTDFEGKEIATNTGAAFEAEELAWLQRELEHGQKSAAVFALHDEHWLVAVEPLTYARTSSPEGALLYKLRLSDLHVQSPMKLEWGRRAASPDDALVTRIEAPGPFAPLQFQIRGPAPHAAATVERPPYAAVFLFAAILFVAVVAAGARLANVLTRDLQRLEAASKKVIGSSLGTERVPVTGTAEVASLASSINDMLDRLDAQHSALLAEREKLTALTDALRVADRRKDEFLAMLAHELRNPLSPIVAALEVLRQRGPDDALLQHNLDIAGRQLKQLTRLVDDLLDISRITLGKIELRKEPVLLAGVVEQAVETSRPLMAERRHTFQVSLPPDPLWVEADTVRLVQVIANLLNNAAKYTEPGGTVALTVGRDRSEALVRVRDTGRGIPVEFLPRLFTPFIQADTSLDRSYGGLGIGLTLAKRLVTMHGGTLDASSEGRGCGSEFQVRLPLTTPPTETGAPAAHPARGRQRRRGRNPVGSAGSLGPCGRLRP